MYQYLASVKSVIDGDTIAVIIDLGFRLSCTTPVRMFGINAPELHGTGKTDGQKSKDKLTELVSGKTVLLKTVKPSDKYGRYLAEVWLTDGLQAKSVNQTMIDLGFAKPWNGSGEKPI